MDDLLLTAIELDDDDIYDAWMFCQPDKPVSTYDPNWERFDFNLVTAERAKFEYRFEKQDIVRLYDALRLPRFMTMQNGAVVLGLDALCMTLRRLAYPNRLGDLEAEFGRPKTLISAAFNETIDRIWSKHGHLLTELDHSWMRMPIHTPSWMHAETAEARMQGA